MERPEPMSAVWQSNRNFLSIKRTIVFTALNDLKNPETVSIAHVVRFSLLSLFNMRSFSSQLIPSDLCIGSNLKIEFTFPVEWFAGDEDSTRIGSKRSNEQSLTSFKFCNAALPSRRNWCTKLSFLFQILFASIEKRGRSLRLLHTYDKAFSFDFFS